MAILAALIASATLSGASPLPGATLVDQGPAGGTVWSQNIANPFVPAERRDTQIYLPPDYSAANRYPVLYLLHGFWGEPSSFVLALHLQDVADELIRQGAVRPFIAVMQPGGPPTGSKQVRAESEWAGASEDFVVKTVVPWIEQHLSTIPDAQSRAIAGVSAGGFGAVDIALRHLGVFGTAESWEGYFKPFRDGPFAHASAATLSAHDPVLLVHKEAATIRSRKLRFFLSTGGSHGGVKRSWTFAFDRELRSLRIKDELWSQAPGIPGFGRHQLPAALEYAEPVG